MPQTNYLPLYTASYPILAKVQKPGGVTVATTVGAGDVPNKPTYVAGTIQMTQLDAPAEEQEESVAQENHLPHTQEDVEEATMEEAEEDEPEPEHHPHPRGGGRGRRR